MILKVEEATAVSNYFDEDLYFYSSTETITETESFSFLKDREILLSTNFICLCTIRS